ncbi:MAG TPA: AMP-binding protein [Pirellulales bacterium]|jgi:acyl-CoA synthetase (AMP-forming)/AMP-acid ligase II/acyl carrier protein
MNTGLTEQATNVSNEHQLPAQGAGEVGRRAANLVEVFRCRAREQADKIAFTFLATDESAVVDRTYGQLDQQARAIAAHLQARCRPLDRVLLMYDSGLDYIAALAGCLYAGVVAVPVFAPDPTRVARTLPRLDAIVRDAQAEVLLGTASDLAWAGALLGQLPGLAQLVPSDVIDLAGAADWNPPHLDRGTPAFLQYTSGSTGTPKGVLVRHGNVLANMAQMEALIDVDDALACTWLPAYHDMGLVGGIFQCWYSGRRNVMMSPLAFFQQPLRWLRAAADYRATTIAAPDFAFDLCVRKIKPEEREQLDLSCVQLALSGAEPVRAATIDRFVEAFAGSGIQRRVFSPCYGMAEATLLISATQPRSESTVRSFDGAQLERNRAVVAAADDAGARMLVGCGRGPENQRLLIVDPRTCHPLEAGQVGEIWVAGPHVASEYWGQPEASAETFRAVTSEGQGPFLRTGDLGFLDGDELFISGRRKDMIIVHGRNYYPQDIEQAIEACHPAIKPRASAAFSVDNNGRERVVVVQEVSRPTKVDLDEVSHAVRRAIFETFELAVDTVVLIRAGSIPKTTSGKIQRRACRELFLSGEIDVLLCSDKITGNDSQASYVAPRNDLEREIADVWCEVLGLDRVSVMDRFFDLGGTSLLATQLINRLAPTLGANIPLSELFDRPTIAQLAELIACKRAAQQMHDTELLAYLDHLSDDEVDRILDKVNAPSPPKAYVRVPVLNLDYIVPSDRGSESAGDAT